MKKLTFAVLILVVMAGGAAAQGNTISAGAGGGLALPLMGYGEFYAAYERQITPHFAAGINFAYELYPLALFAVAFTQEPNILGYVVDIQVHWYPTGRAFHVDAGLGYGRYLWTMHSVVFTPGIGWKFVLGKSHGLAFLIDIRGEYFFPLGENIFKSSNKDSELIPWNLGPRLGIGYSF